MTIKEKWTMIWRAEQVPNGEKLVAFLYTLFGFTPKPPVKDGGGNLETSSFDVQRYEEKYRKSPNQSGSIDPKFIVLHDAYGSWLGTTSWILKKVSRVSYHYLINTDGSRVQFVFDKKKAWHAGKSYWKGYANLNSHSIGIAFTGNGRDVSEKEIDSCARKCLYLLGKFPKMQRNPLKETIIRHQHIAPARKQDTTHQNWKRVIERVEELQKEKLS